MYTSVFFVEQEELSPGYLQQWDNYLADMIEYYGLETQVALAA